MFYSRKLNRETGGVEVWECEWSNLGTGMARKEFIRKHGDEGDVEFEHDHYSAASAICWAPGRTIGNTAVSSEEVFGHFEGKSGTNAVLPCHIVPCGKFRNGANRWYCKTHQIHWRTNADRAALPESGEVRCSSHSMEMSYVVNPLQVEFNDYAEIGICCSLPPALSSRPIVKRAPKVHVHKRQLSASANSHSDPFRTMTGKPRRRQLPRYKVILAYVLADLRRSRRHSLRAESSLFAIRKYRCLLSEIHQASSEYREVQYLFAMRL